MYSAPPFGGSFLNVVVVKMARRSSGRRSSKSWVGVAFDDVAATTTQGELANISVVEQAFNTTLLRSRGQIIVMANGDNVADTDTLCLGMIVVHTNAVTAGGVSLPGPAQDFGADWLWHQFVPLDSGGGVGASQAFGGTVRTIEIDSKAMRRVPADHAVVLMAETISGDFASVQLSGGMRLLFGLQ